MQVLKNVEVKYADGKLVAEILVKDVVLSFIAKVEEKVESGAIDPIKGTDMDKVAIKGALDLLKGMV